MLNCKETTALLSQGLDRPLQLGEKLNMQIHLATCEGCRNFKRQMAFLRNATSSLIEQTRSDNGENLS